MDQSSSASAPPSIDVSIVIPVYRNESTLRGLLDLLSEIQGELGGGMEVVFVVDGSPDRCEAILAAALGEQPFESRLLTHSRNFGSLAAVRTGLASAQGRHLVVMAADLQETRQWVIDCLHALQNGADVVVGVRRKRSDPWGTRMAAGIFWGLYRRLVNRSIPAGGVDVFGCNTAVRDHLLSMGESHTSLVGQLYWVGFRREQVEYERVARPSGKSGWSFSRRVQYLLDSVFAFTDLPIRLLAMTGFGGLFFVVIISAVTLAAKLMGLIEVPGYTGILLSVLFMGALNLLSVGVVGMYMWRAFENTKQRPLSIVMRDLKFESSAL